MIAHKKFRNSLRNIWVVIKRLQYDGPYSHRNPLESMPQLDIGPGTFTTTLALGNGYV